MIIVSACLLGLACRYDGSEKRHEGVCRHLDGKQYVPVCPEQMGGLPTPRPPAEIIGDRVVNREGEDVTEAFHRGAMETLKLARMVGATQAILKANSPSCGNACVYDGTFSKVLREGKGVTAILLEREGVTVRSEQDIEENE